MNANELADELQACFTKADWEYVNECAAMLRQQQAEIEALKIKHDAIACSSCACGFIKRGKAQEK